MTTMIDEKSVCGAIHPRNPLVICELEPGHEGSHYMGYRTTAWATIRREDDSIREQKQVDVTQQIIWANEEEA